MNNAIPVKRGCGTRKEAGIYGECGMGKGGQSIEHFLIDSPHRIDKKELGITDIGVKLIEVNGIWHILDIVGQENYPNVADFVEEARRFGVSRRFPKTLNFSKLTPQSRMLLAHKRAWIDNFDEYANYWIPQDAKEWDNSPAQYNPCPKPIDEHTFTCHPEMCAGVWWQDIDQVLSVTDRHVERHMPSFSYSAATRPYHVKPQYQLAIFGAFPLSRLVVIEARDGSHQESLDKASRANVTVDVEAE